MNYDNSYAAIDLDALSENFQAIREKAGVPVMAIVKANAYGHGAVRLARHLQDACAFFGVSCLQEALELRRAGLTKPILILGAMPAPMFGTAIRVGIRPTIFRYEDAKVLSDEAVKQGVQAPFHFAVDTGMSRIGFQVTEEAADICACIAKLPGLICEGLFSHFATADCADLTRARRQAELYDRFDAMLRSRGVTVAIRHLDNSAGLMNFTGHYDMVRSGIITYGLYPSDEVSPELLKLKPVLSWYSRITHIKQLEPGREISYGGTFVTDRPTLVATVAVGYADGYRRNLSGKFYVLIRGKRAPILGRVCMDMMMVDVTDIPGVTLEDRVTLIGRDGDSVISVEEIAACGDSFNYEFVCGIGHRVPRVYYRNGQVVYTDHYLLDRYTSSQT